MKPESPESTAFVRTEVADGIATIRFFHPQSNSLPGEILRRLAHAIDDAAGHPEVRVLVLQSQGEKAFCAGASFDELISIESREAGQYFFEGFSLVILAIRRCPKLVIGRVQGKAVGGGVGLAAAVDYCIATTAAAIKLSELAVGIGPFVVGPAVERKLGLAGMSALAIDASSWRSAEWAAQHGLYAELHPDLATLDLAVKRLATQLSQSSPEAMSDLKRVLWEGTEHWPDLLPSRAAVSGRLVLSDFTRQAIQAFKSKP